MENPHDGKVWYKKKRYIIPAGLLGLLWLTSLGDEPSEFVVPVVNQKTENVVVESTELNNFIPPVSTTKPKEVEQPKPIYTPPATQNCNPNYSGCLKPDASDYDCAGGSGNGPYYTGKVRVIGYDEYGLDRDGNGWGCE